MIHIRYIDNPAGIRNVMYVECDVHGVVSGIMERPREATAVAEAHLSTAHQAGGRPSRKTR